MNRSYHWKSWNKNHQNSWCFCYTFEELCVKFVWQQLEWTMPRQDDWHCVVTNVQVKTAINRFRLSSQFTFMWRWVLMFLQYNPLMHSKLRCGRGNESTSWYNVADWITFLSSLLMSPFCCCFFFSESKSVEPQPVISVSRFSYLLIFCTKDQYYCCVCRKLAVLSERTCGAIVRR